MLSQPLYTLEPYHLHSPCAIGEKPYKPLSGPFPLHGHGDESSLELNRWHIIHSRPLQLGNCTYGCAVDIMGREMIQHIIISPYAEILVKKLGTLGPHPTQEFYVGITQPVHSVLFVRYHRDLSL